MCHPQLFVYPRDISYLPNILRIYSTPISTPQEILYPIAVQTKLKTKKLANESELAVPSILSLDSFCRNWKDAIKYLERCVPRYSMSEFLKYAKFLLHRLYSHQIGWFFRGLGIFACTALLKISSPIKQFFVTFVQFVGVRIKTFIMLFTVQHSRKVQPVLSTRLVFQWDGTPL